MATTEYFADDTVYQSTALVETDAPSDWPTFWRQQLRWGRSSQRETLLTLGWLWRRPVAFASFVTDVVTPFALYAVLGLAVTHALVGHHGVTGLPLPYELPLGYLGMLVSIGVRQASLPLRPGRACPSTRRARRTDRPGPR